MHKGAAEQQGATSRAAAGQEDILAAIERMAELQARGVLTETEFSMKKAELLARLWPSGQDDVFAPSSQVGFAGTPPFAREMQTRYVSFPKQP